MHLFHLIALPIYISSSTISASPLHPRSNNSTSLLATPNDPDPNTTANLTDIDGRFRLIPGHPEVIHPIHPISTYLNAITLLRDLASAEFHAPAPASADQSEAPWRDVVIAWTRQSRARENRFLIWGLWLALEWFRRNGFGANGFTLVWDRREMGTLKFVDTDADAGGEAASNATTTTLERKVLSPSTKTLTLSNIGTSNLTTPLNARLDIEFTWNPSGLSLDVPDFLTPIASAMVLLAQYPATDRTRWFYARPKAGCQGMLHLGGPPVEPVQWPFLRNSDALLVLFQIADMAAKEPWFAELDVEAEINRVEVARAEVRRQYRAGGVGGGGGEVPEGSAVVRI